MSKLEFLFKHSKTLYELILENSLDICKSQELKNLKRLLIEQIKVNNDDNYTPKENNDLKPDIPHNPSDLDATCRFNMVIIPDTLVM